MTLRLDAGLLLWLLDGATSLVSQEPNPTRKPPMNCIPCDQSWPPPGRSLFSCVHWGVSKLSNANILASFSQTVCVNKVSFV